jgi:thiamine biosynthesis lipoprotein
VISRLNREAADHPVPVPPEVASLLRWCREAATATQRAFDPAIGHLMRAAGFRDEPRGTPMHGTLSLSEKHSSPSPGRTPTVREGLENPTQLHAPSYDVDPANRVTLHPGIALDLGAIGKGWALDRAGETLREHGVTSALLHGGTSSVTTIGGPWHIALDAATAIDLTDDSLGLSAPSGRRLTDTAGQIHGHILNPRTGESARALTAAAVTGTSAAVCDAWSTALIVNPRLAQAPTWPIGYRAHLDRGSGFSTPSAHPDPSTLSPPRAPAPHHEGTLR